MTVLMSVPVLKKTVKVLEEAPKGIRYDQKTQIWFSVDHDIPFVEEVVTNRLTEAFSSRFGETMLTDAVEGSDKPTAANPMLCSMFGETLLTKTSEGSDQSEIASFSSRFGETMITRTAGEGSDR